MGKSMTKAEREAKKKLFLEAMNDSWGMVTTSCERAGVSKVTISKWRKDDKEFDDAINSIKDKQKEWVEGQLMTAIRNGSVSATVFFLKTQCGWSEKQKLEIEQIGAVDIEKAIDEISERMKNKKD